MASSKKYIFTIITVCLLSLNLSAEELTGMISGKVLSSDGDPIDYANVYLKGTTYSGTTNDKGLYHINAPAGNYTIVFSSVGCYCISGIIFKIKRVDVTGTFRSQFIGNGYLVGI